MSDPNNDPETINRMQQQIEQSERGRAALIDEARRLREALVIAIRADGRFGTREYLIGVYLEKVAMFVNAIVDGEDGAKEAEAVARIAAVLADVAVVQRGTERMGVKP
jgi:hypothetical protein